MSQFVKVSKLSTDLTIVLCSALNIVKARFGLSVKNSNSQLVLQVQNWILLLHCGIESGVKKNFSPFKKLQKQLSRNKL